jgi:hypothetical protein
MKLTFFVACGRTDDLNHHHLFPRSVGGLDDESNLITLCRECHGKMHGVEWKLGLGELIKKGHAAAKARGVKFGRERKLSEYQRAEAAKRRANGEMLAAIAASYGVDPTTIGRCNPL